VPGKWLLLETTACVELASHMIRKLQVTLPELLVIKLWQYVETAGRVDLANLVMVMQF
jgi:hypothetical protein